MDQLHKLCLQRHHTYLLENLDPDLVLSYLYQERILTSDNMSIVKAEKTRENKAYKLLEKLPCGGPDAFNAFIESLKKANQHFIADTLLEELEKSRGLHRSVSDLLWQTLVNILFLHH